MGVRAELTGLNLNIAASCHHREDHGVSAPAGLQISTDLGVRDLDAYLDFRCGQRFVEIWPGDYTERPRILGLLAV